MLQRAYSLIEVKEVAEEADFHVIRGTATTPRPDRMSDVVEPLGATFAETIPLLWQHDSTKPIGQAKLGKPTSKGIPFVATIPIVREAGALKDRIDEAVQSIRYRLIAAVSIGFRVLNGAVETIKETGGLRFLETEILELSVVTIPAQADATISTVKSIAQGYAATSGQKRVSPVRLITPPGVSGKPARKGISLLTPRKDK